MIAGIRSSGPRANGDAMTCTRSVNLCRSHRAAWSVWSDDAACRDRAIRGFAERGPRCRIERNRQRTERKHLRPEVRALVLNLALNHVAFVVNASRRHLVCRGGEKSANWGSVDGKIPVEVRICQRTSIDRVVVVDFRAAACTFVVGVAQKILIGKRDVVLKVLIFQRQTTGRIHAASIVNRDRASPYFFVDCAGNTW